MEKSSKHTDLETCFRLITEYLEAEKLDNSVTLRSFMEWMVKDSPDDDDGLLRAKVVSRGLMVMANLARGRSNDNLLGIQDDSPSSPTRGS